MTAPTGPDSDRTGSGNGQKTCGRPGCGHICDDHPVSQCWAVGCSCLAFRPAPQQPPAQEREGCPYAIYENHTAPCEYCPAPPSEADSAGEDELERIAAVLRWHLPDHAQDSGCAMRCGYDGDDLGEHLAAALAASSGVRGGDGEARERLAAAWDEGYRAAHDLWSQTMAGRKKDAPANPHRSAGDA